LGINGFLARAPIFGYDSFRASAPALGRQVDEGGIEMANHGMDGKSIALDRDIFFRSLIRELAGTLEELLGAKKRAVL
jgi:hypothetical protein